MRPSRIFNRRKSARLIGNDFSVKAHKGGHDEYQVEIFSEDFKIIRNVMVFLIIAGIFAAIHYKKIYEANRFLYEKEVADFVRSVVNFSDFDGKRLYLNKSGAVVPVYVKKYSSAESFGFLAAIASLLDERPIYEVGEKSTLRIDFDVGQSGRNSSVLYVKRYSQADPIESLIKKSLDVSRYSDGEAVYREVLERCSGESYGSLGVVVGSGKYKNRRDIIFSGGSGYYEIKGNSRVYLYYTFAPNALKSGGDINCREDYGIHFFSSSKFRPLGGINLNSFNPFGDYYDSSAVSFLEERVKLLDFFDFPLIKLPWILPVSYLSFLIFFSSVLRKYAYLFSRHVPFRQLVFFTEGSTKNVSFLDFWLLRGMEKFVRGVLVSLALLVPLGVVFFTPFVTDPEMMPYEYIGVGSLVLYVNTIGGAWWAVMMSVTLYFTAHVFIVIFSGGMGREVGLNKSHWKIRSLLFVVVWVPSLVLLIAISYAYYSDISVCFIGDCGRFEGIYLFFYFLSLSSFFLYFLVYLLTLIVGPFAVFGRILGVVLLLFFAAFSVFLPFHIYGVFYLGALQS